MIAVNFFSWFLLYFREEGSIKLETSVYNNRLKQNSNEQMDLWIQEEGRINPQEIFFSKDTCKQAWGLVCHILLVRNRYEKSSINFKV